LLIIHFYCSTDIQIDQLERSGAFKLDEVNKGWLLRRGESATWRRMCWLPYKRRNDPFILACSGQKVAIAAGGGLMTILDFSEV
jgi:hypothetical protein